MVIRVSFFNINTHELNMNYSSIIFDVIYLKRIVLIEN